MISHLVFNDLKRINAWWIAPLLLSLLLPMGMLLVPVWIMIAFSANHEEIQPVLQRLPITASLRSRYRWLGQMGLPGLLILLGVGYLQWQTRSLLATSSGAADTLLLQHIALSVLALCCIGFISWHWLSAYIPGYKPYHNLAWMACAGAGLYGLFKTEYRTTPILFSVDLILYMASYVTVSIGIQPRPATRFTPSTQTVAHPPSTLRGHWLDRILGNPLSATFLFVIVLLPAIVLLGSFFPNHPFLPTLLSFFGVLILFQFHDGLLVFLTLPLGKSERFSYLLATIFLASLPMIVFAILKLHLWGRVPFPVFLKTSATLALLVCALVTLSIMANTVWGHVSGTVFLLLFLNSFLFRLHQSSTVHFFRDVLVESTIILPISLLLLPGLLLLYLDSCQKNGAQFQREINRKKSQNAKD